VFSIVCIVSLSGFSSCNSPLNIENAPQPPQQEISPGVGKRGFIRISTEFI
jgi:hypothetical protein